MSYPMLEAGQRAGHRRTSTPPSPPEIPPGPPPFRPPMGPAPSPSPSPHAEDAEQLGATEEPQGRPSTPASPPDGTPPAGGKLAKASERGLTKAAEMAFRGVGEALHDAMAEDRPAEQEPDEIWLATDAEAEGVAEPAGRIISRRVPDLPGDQGDAADLIALAIPLGIWLIRGLVESAPRIMRARRAQRVIEGRLEQEAGPRDV